MTHSECVLLNTTPTTQCFSVRFKPFIRLLHNNIFTDLTSMVTLQRRANEADSLLCPVWGVQQT